MNFIEAKELKELGRKLDWYGDKELFSKKLAEGFTEVAFGEGSWIETPNHPHRARRIVALWAFFHPDYNSGFRLFGFRFNRRGERITILAHPKVVEPDSQYSSTNLDTFVKHFNPRAFWEYIERQQIGIALKYPLHTIVEHYDGLVDFYNNRGVTDLGLKDTSNTLQLKTS